MVCADTSLVQLREGLLHMTVPRFKQRFSLVQPTRNSLHAVMDTAKVCDSIVFLLCPHTAMDSWGETLLSSVLAQGLPCQPVFVVGSMDEIPAKKQSEVKKLLVKALERKLPVEKVWSMQEQGEAVNILRTLGTQKRKEGSFKNRRGHLLAEKVEFTETGEGAGTLAVTGFVRGAAISANRLVHLPGWGDFQVDRIEAAPEPLRLRGAREQEMEEVEVVQRADPALRQELDCENCPDGMDGEQTWPTEEELQAADIAAHPATRKVAKVPRGMSEYQAAWIQEEGEEDQDQEEEEEDDGDDEMEDSAEIPCEAEDDSSENEKEEDRDCDTQTETMTEAGDGDYDAKHVNFAAEVDEMEALRTARVDSMFPDEIDTPMDVPARIRYVQAGLILHDDPGSLIPDVITGIDKAYISCPLIRFQKYRGLKSFRTSAWDPRENLPADYARIFQFENFDRTRKRVLSEPAEGAEVGRYVTVYVGGVGAHLYSSLDTSALLLTSLLPHEHRMSVLNMVVRRSPLAREAPVKSKQRLIFQV